MSRIITLSQEPAASVGTTINVGVTTLAPSVDSGNAGKILGQKVNLAVAGTLLSLSFYTGNAVGSLKLALYDATGASGGPGQKLAETASVASIVGWNTLNVISQVALAPANYWLVYEVSSNAMTFRSGAGGNLAFANQVYGTMPATFPAPVTNGTDSWSFYMTIATGSPPPPDTIAPSAPTNLTGVPI